jgi:hypothetical protein
LKRFSSLVFRFNISTLQRFRLICLLVSRPVVHGNNRTMDRQCATACCFHTAGICLADRRASGLRLSACAIAFLMFCVSGLPWARYESISEPENNGQGLKR